jgi:integrase
LTARLDGSKKRFSGEYARKLLLTANRFFSWLFRHESGYRGLTETWIDSLKPRRNAHARKEAKGITLNEILVIDDANVDTIWQKRIRTSAIFMFLSGIRVGAFVSLSLCAIDLDNCVIKQWPELGVKTKFQKHASTYLLPIPELLEVVLEWENSLREVLSETDYWFAPISPETGMVDRHPHLIGRHRADRARKNLRRWLKIVGLPYFSPHQFSHGHALYALKQAKDVGDWRAVSRNLMLSNLSTTDGVYGLFSETDVQERIGALGQQLDHTTLSREEFESLLIKTLQSLSEQDS